MILGDFSFDLKTLNPNTLSRTTEYNWGSSERVGDLPNLQNLGASNDQIEIEGVFFPNFSGTNSLGLTTDNNTVNGILRILTSDTGKYTSVDDIRNSTLCTMANALISDSGDILGRYVITQIKETQSYFDASGKPKTVEFAITLRRSPEESATTTLISDGVSSLVDAVINIARSYLRW